MFQWAPTLLGLNTVPGGHTMLSSQSQHQASLEKELCRLGSQLGAAQHRAQDATWGLRAKARLQRTYVWLPWFVGVFFKCHCIFIFLYTWPCSSQFTPPPVLQTYQFFHHVISPLYSHLFDCSFEDSQLQELVLQFVFGFLYYLFI